MAKRKFTGQNPLVSGPFTGVYDTNDPYDDQPNVLTDARNGYFPDLKNGPSAFYGRPGWTLLGTAGSGTQFGTPPSSAYGQGMHGFINASGTALNFEVVGGKLYRAGTDVTPANIRIINATSGSGEPGLFNARVFLIDFLDTLIVSDGINKPWQATNLSNTPVTGTLIEYRDSAAAPSIGVPDTRVAVPSFTYLNVDQVGGVGPGTVNTASSAGLALATGTIPINKWGIYRIIVTVATGTLSMLTGAANFTTGYNTEALAIAALPALAGATQWNVAYFTVQTKVGTTFVGGTDALAGGASGNIANATNYYQGEGPPWAAFGCPKIYIGSVMYICAQLGGVPFRTSIIWSEPGFPLVGYQKTSPNGLLYDNLWTLEQTASNPIYAIETTNTALWYARGSSWGTTSGVPGPGFAANATHDAIDLGVGVRSAASTCLWGNDLWFCDELGRPWRCPLGGTPDPVWLDMRAIASPPTTAVRAPVSVERTTAYCTAAIEPTLMLYVVAVWARSSATGNPPYPPPTEMYAFDLNTGAYCGRWNIASGTDSLSSISIHCLGTQIGTIAGGPARPVLAALGTNAAQSTTQGNADGHLWTLNTPTATDVDGYLDTGAGFPDDYVAQPPRSIVTGRLGYSAGVYLVADILTAIENTTTTLTYPLDLTLNTESTTATTVVTATPAASKDGTARCVWGLNSAGRGFQPTITVHPYTPLVDSARAFQWQIHRVEMQAIPSLAQPSDA